MDPRLGDFSGNASKIIEACEKSFSEGGQLFLFPEASLCGYPAGDLLEWPEFVQAQSAQLKKIHSKLPKGCTALVGLFTQSEFVKKSFRGKPFHNSVAVIERAKPIRFIHKEILPVGDIFDEGRYFQEFPKYQNRIVKVAGARILITICEEMWAWQLGRRQNPHLTNPLTKYKQEKPDLIINLSASPFHLEKFEERRQMAKATANYFQAPLVYVNRIGTQDEILFDGRSFVTDRLGKLIEECPEFKVCSESFFFNRKLQKISRVDQEKGADLLAIKTQKPPRKADMRTAAQRLNVALVEGLRGFVQGSGFSQVHLGLSGGIDSAVVAALAAEALGAANVTCYALPTRFNQEMSLNLARELAQNLNCGFRVFGVDPLYNQMSEEIVRELQLSEFGLMHENLQARIRGVFLMAVANTRASLLLSTANKSELAVGYSTLYGDMCGALAPIGDLTKRQVYDLAQEMNRYGEIIPKGIISRAPSAELRPGQKDQDSLPEYDSLDKAVDKVVGLSERKNSLALERWLKLKLMGSEFKRWQAPPVLKVSKRSFGKGRRWPLFLASKDWLKK